jgi:L-fuconolactonase
MVDSPLKSLGVTNAIDTHVHPWRLADLPPVIQGAREVRPDLAQDYSPERIIDTAKSSGFNGVILVQARDYHEDSAAEARFFISAAKEHPQVLGCVIGVDLLNPSATEQMLGSLDGASVVRGGRMIKPENVGVGILSDTRAKETCKLLGASGLSMDLLIRSSNPGQLNEAVDLVSWLATNTKTTVIGDHLLKPTGVAAGTPSAEWLSSLSELAKCPNFYLKLSGLPGELPEGSDFRPFWAFYDAAFEAFGPKRLMFGSDYPVSYGHSASVKAVTDWLVGRGLTDQSTLNAIFGDNARVAYGIKQTR